MVSLVHLISALTENHLFGVRVYEIQTKPSGMRSATRVFICDFPGLRNEQTLLLDFLESKRSEEISGNCGVDNMLSLGGNGRSWLQFDRSRDWSRQNVRNIKSSGLPNLKRWRPAAVDHLNVQFKILPSLELTHRIVRHPDPCPLFVPERFLGSFRSNYSILGESFSGHSLGLGIVGDSLRPVGLILGLSGQFVSIRAALLNFEQSITSGFSGALRGIGAFVGYRGLPNADSTADERSEKQQAGKNRHPGIDSYLSIFELLVACLGCGSLSLYFAKSSFENGNVALIVKWGAAVICLIIGQFCFSLILRAFFG